MRQRFFMWFKQRVAKVPEGEMIPKYARLIWVILFPIKALHYSVERREGYQPESDIWIIHGYRYSGALFEHFAYGNDDTFKIVKRENGTITLERY